ncbi:hypothetical protein N9D31_02785 [Oligoflexaceae bacterium]|nr:hypothetical protein [Oligoflexaceae bacterium]
MKTRVQNQNFVTMLLVVTLFSLCLALFAIGCGSKKSGGGGNSDGSGEINNSFALAASQNRIPLDLLKAVAFYESNMSPESSSVPYLNTGSKEDRRNLGFSLAETAFGISKADLQIAKEKDSSTMSAQVDAYAKWIREGIEDVDQMNVNLSSPEDYSAWILELARLHRGEDGDGRYVQSVWANELIDVLNQGRTWQNFEGTEKIELLPANPPIDKDDFPIETQPLFQLSTSQGEIFTSQMFPLYQHPTTLPNAPNHVKIIHCPLSLSACLEIQNLKSNGDSARLRAHFVIPPYESNNNGTERQFAYQVTPMAYAVELTNAQGDLQEVSDAVVIMLTGKSGRYVKGQRLYANPAWYTPRQLQILGSVVKDVCQKLSQESDQVNALECRTPGSARGVQFLAQGPFDPTYKWGDIPDFEPTIFETYITANDSITDGEAKFEFQNRSKRYHAMHKFDYSVRFPRQARAVQIERAIRCPGGKIVWAPLTGAAVQSKNSYMFTSEIHDGGPNGNGETYLRARVYDERNELLAWTVDKIFLYNFDPESKAIAPSTCLRSGT